MLDVVKNFKCGHALLVFAVKQFGKCQGKICIIQSNMDPVVFLSLLISDGHE